MTQATREGKVRPLQTTSQGCPTAHLLYNFDIGSAVLKAAHKRFLQETLAETLRNTTAHRVRLVGRASRSSSDEVNLRLSQQRVEAVAKFLTHAGVAREQLHTEFIGESAPFSTADEAEEDRSVEVHLQITPVLILVLQNASLVHPVSVLISTIREAIEPLAQQAGRQLRIGQSFLDQSAELTLDFDTGGRETRPCAGILILGNEGGSTIFVGAHESLRVCSGPQGDPRDLDHVTQLAHVFENGEPEFARFVGNTAVHELGHRMAQLEHTADPGNFMYSVGRLGGNLPRELRSRERMRQHWGGRKWFNSAQVQRLVCAIQTGNFTGGMRVGGP